MNKAELIDVLTEKLGTDRRQATAAVENVVDTIVRAVHKGDSVTITGFGVFEQRRRAARVARNPRTGETVKVKPTSVPAFRPGAQFKAVVSGAQRLPAEGPAVKRGVDGGTGPEGCREEGGQEGVVKKAAVKKAVKKAAVKKAAVKKAAVKKAPVQEGRRQEGRREEGAPPRRPRSRRPPPRRPAKKAAAKKAVAKKAAGQEGRASKAAGQEGRRQEGAGQEAGRRNQFRYRRAVDHRDPRRVFAS